MGPTGGQQSGARGVGRDLERLEHASRRSGPRWGQLKRSPPQQSGADFSESLSCFVPFVCFRTSVAAARSMAAYKVVCWAATVSYHRWGEIVSSLRSSQSGVSKMVYHVLSSFGVAPAIGDFDLSNELFKKLRKTNGSNIFLLILNGAGAPFSDVFSPLGCPFGKYTI